MALRLLCRMRGCSMLATSGLRRLHLVGGRAAFSHFGSRSVQNTAQIPVQPRNWAVWAPSRSLHVSPVASASQEGPITSELIDRMRGKIAAALETDMVEVQDMQGDGRHVEITVVSKLFDGKNAVNRQRMVYKAIWEELQDTVHAVDAMVTRTPDEAGI